MTRYKLVIEGIQTSRSDYTKEKAEELKDKLEKICNLKVEVIKNE